MGQILQKLLDVFYTKKLDIVVIGLENRSVLPPRRHDCTIQMEGPTKSMTILL